MAHAKPSDLEDLKVLMGGLRKKTVLKEKSQGCFYFKSKGVLHFHIKGERRFAHVFDGKKWHEVDIKPAPTLIQQKRLLNAIFELLPI